MVETVAFGVIILCICGTRAAAASSRSAERSSGPGTPSAILDPSFGNGGETVVPSAFSTVFGAATEDGSLLVSDGASIQVLSSLGGIGEAFGGVGTLEPPAAVGRKFALGDLTVDRQGRLLVVGSSLYPEAEDASPIREEGGFAFGPAALRIIRLLPDGALDPSFGQGGVLETDLGLPAPLAANGRRRLGTHPTIRTTGVVIDSQGRIVVTGNAVVRLGEPCERNVVRPAVISAGFVARVSEAGAIDPTFGKGGLIGGRHLEELPLGAEVIGEPMVAPTGTITYRSSRVYRCPKAKSYIGIAQLTPSGRARSAFGKKGALVGKYRAITGGSDGSVFALEETRPRENGRIVIRPRIERIAPDGRADSSYGTDGRATIRLGPEPGLNSLAVDSQGRVLVGGTQGADNNRSMILLRMSASGKQEMGFGPHGRVANRFSELEFPGALFFDGQGHLVAVHPYANLRTDLNGVAVARYLLRN